MNRFAEMLAELRLRAMGLEFDNREIALKLIDRLEYFSKADFVLVVRCNECKHSKPPAVLTQKYGKPGTLTCHNWHSPCNKRNVNKEDYCSYGERKDND